MNVLLLVEGRENRRLLAERLAARHQAEAPVFLPFLLVTSRADVTTRTRHLWQTIDELIITPIEEMELQACLEMLLRAWRDSLELQRVSSEKLRASEEQSCKRRRWKRWGGWLAPWRTISTTC